VTSPPVPHGAILIDPQGRIAAVGPDGQVPRPGNAAADAYADAALLPGFVNAHTHLELTGLRGQVTEPDFFQWIQHVRRAKEDTSQETFLQWARQGLREAWRHGTTLIADTGTSGAVARALTELHGAGIVYHEAMAPEPGKATLTLGSLRADVERLRAAVGDRVVIGVSPHAPYTVSRTLYQQVADYARSEGLPLAGHIAESRAEVELVASAGGPFADAWRRRGIPLDPPAPSPVRLLEHLGVLGKDFLAIHAVQTDEADAQALARAGSAIVLCPRSNRRHGHGAPPLSRYLSLGLRVALGTDSLASVASLDPVAEGREARVLSGLSAEDTIALLTLGGARALGCDRETGSLEPGKWGDLCLVRLPTPIPQDPGLAAEALLLGRPEDIVATFVSGRAVHEARGEGA
jgi:5-methylthioadenosine/S-adenosylhomocysteine deaminase